MSEQIRCRLVSRPALFMMEATLPADLIEKVNAHIDASRETAGDYSQHLVGQIKRRRQSAQLQLPLTERMPGILSDVIVGIAKQYVGHLGFDAKISANDMWSIHSYDGDYNPLHDHGSDTDLGLSSVLYLKVPPVIAEKPSVGEGMAPRLAMASGNCDGFTQFVWGASGTRDFHLLRPPTQQYVKPEVGKLLIFPNWLLHRVEPFFGDGERRTLSCNMNVEISGVAATASDAFKQQFH